MEHRNQQGWWPSSARGILKS